MITKYLGATVVVLLLALAAAGVLYQNTVEAKAVAEAQRDGYLEALEFQTELVRERDAMVKQREQQRLEAEQAADVWRKKWKEAQRNDASCEAWADTELPNCVMELFKQPRTSDYRQPRASGLFANNTRM